jgi:hypothetical protein
VCVCVCVYVKAGNGRLPPHHDTSQLFAVFKRNVGNARRSINVLVDARYLLDPATRTSLRDGIKFMQQWLCEKDVWMRFPFLNDHALAVLSDCFHRQLNLEVGYSDILQVFGLLRLLRSNSSARLCVDGHPGHHLAPELPGLNAGDVALGPKLLILKVQIYVIFAIECFQGCLNTETVELHDLCFFVQPTVAAYALAMAERLVRLPSLTTFRLVVSELHPNTRGYWTAAFFRTVLGHRGVRHLNIKLNHFLRDIIQGALVEDRSRLARELFFACFDNYHFLTIDVDPELVGTDGVSELRALARRNLRNQATQKQDKYSQRMFGMWLARTLVELDHDPSQHLILVQEFLVPWMARGFR